MSTNCTGEPIRSALVEEDPSFADIVLDYVRELEKRVKGLREAMELHDLDRVRTLAHQLKGSGGGHGYPILTTVAGELESHAADQRVEPCLAAITELAILVPRIVAGAPTLE